MGQCMEMLTSKDFPALLRECIRSKPFLGICLGLQTLMDFSEEDGGTDGLGVIPGKVIRFPAAALDENGDPVQDSAYGLERGKTNSASPPVEKYQNR